MQVGFTLQFIQELTADSLFRDHISDVLVFGNNTGAIRSDLRDKEAGSAQVYQVLLGEIRKVATGNACEALDSVLNNQGCSHLIILRIFPTVPTRRH